MEDSPQIYVHSDPIWRERANFVIAADFVDDGVMGREQLWARQLSPFEYEICCIPFFLRNVALGDVVETDSGFVVQRIIRPSRRFVFRAWLSAGNWLSRPELAKPMLERGALLEFSSPRLMAIDAADEVMAQDISGYLSRLELDGSLVYETGQ